MSSQLDCNDRKFHYDAENDMCINDGSTGMYGKHIVIWGVAITHSKTHSTIKSQTYQCVVGHTLD